MKLKMTVKGDHGQRARCARWWIKRWTARARRRAAKALLQDAPTRSLYRGWLA